MKVFAIPFEKEVKCGGCNWTVFKLYVLAETEREAREIVKKGEGGLCADCMLEVLSEGNYEIFSSSLSEDKFKQAILLLEEVKAQLKKSIEKAFKNYGIKKEKIRELLSKQASINMQRGNDKYYCGFTYHSKNGSVRKHLVTLHKGEMEKFKEVIKKYIKFKKINKMLYVIAKL